MYVDGFALCHQLEELEEEEMVRWRLNGFLQAQPWPYAYFPKLDNKENWEWRVGEKKRVRAELEDGAAGSGARGDGGSEALKAVQSGTEFFPPDSASATTVAPSQELDAELPEWARRAWLVQWGRSSEDGSAAPRSE
ncbi:hypothetical protein FB451DRAFT_1162274 [Mycena latifolia]|nr:hypothetical protein FB451DRAFT_1162274 [Mycena latifolia]